MRTVTDATLFIVKGPKGSYYAIRENETGDVVTERTEQAAAARANERDMILVERREISHAELLAMLASQCDRSQSGSAGADRAQAMSEDFEPRLANFAQFVPQIAAGEPEAP